jgi:hypothetical protein
MRTQTGGAWLQTRQWCRDIAKLRLDSTSDMQKAGVLDSSQIESDHALLQSDNFWRPWTE